MVALMDKVLGRKCLLEVDVLLKQLGVPYFLTLGTALGAYRDKGFTPDEKDIDLGFLQEVFTPESGRIASVCESAGFVVRSISRPFSRCRVVILQRDGVKVDLASYVLWKGKRFCCNSDPNTKPYSLVYDRRLLECYQSVSMFGVDFLVPEPIESYLGLEYGPTWRIPAPDSVSRTRVYGFRQQEGIPDDWLEKSALAQA